MNIHQNKILYYETPALCYNDLTIVPSISTSIVHRSECDPYNADKMLPIFTAPMSTVVDIDTSKIYEENKITPIIPRNVEYEKRYEMLKKGKWVALSLSEFDKLIKNEDIDPNYHILIDVANGHMQDIFYLSSQAKIMCKDFKLMAGNIANPLTIEKYMFAGIDYVRLSVGTGSGCITTSNVGIHYPIASLILDTYQKRKDIWDNRHMPIIKHKDINGILTNTKIIADGGIKNYDDVVKALALGADYVMIGGLFASCIESPGDLYLKDDNSGNVIEPYNIESLKEKGYFYLEIPFGECPKIRLEDKMIVKEFYGMASSKGQIDINGNKTKTSEGLVKKIVVDKSLYKWSNNMADYIRSTMSYLNILKLKDFKYATLIRISDSTKNSINK